MSWTNTHYYVGLLCILPDVQIRIIIPDIVYCKRFNEERLKGATLEVGHTMSNVELLVPHAH